MVDLKRYLIYLKKNGLTAEEFLLLYVIWNRNEFPENTEMLMLSDFYYKRFQFYDREAQPTSISWDKMLAKLIKEGFVIAYPKYMEKNGNDYFLNLMKLQVTDKFKDTVFTSDKEGYWADFVKIYGTYFIVNEKRVSTLMSDEGETLDDIKNKFWTLCQNGNAYYCMKILDETARYVKAFSNNRKITRFLNDYEACMLSLAEYEANKKEIKNTWNRDID